MFVEFKEREREMVQRRSVNYKYLKKCYNRFAAPFETNMIPFHNIKIVIQESPKHKAIYKKRTPIYFLVFLKTNQAKEK